MTVEVLLIVSACYLHNAKRCLLRIFVKNDPIAVVVLLLWLQLNDGRASGVDEVRPCAAKAGHRSDGATFDRRTYLLLFLRQRRPRTKILLDSRKRDSAKTERMTIQSWHESG